MVTQSTQELARLQAEFLISVGAAPDLIETRALPCYLDCATLVLAATSQSGRRYMLHPDAASAWSKMQAAAVADGVSLIMISAFRDFDYQAELIRKKLAAGQDIEVVLETLAPPGCSEHHSGMACDIGTLGCPPAEEEFEQTDAFAWLTTHADRFGFRMSFGRSNPYGYIYEPWHWRYHSVS